MDRSKVVERIRKCMALARSSNAHEAAVAMRQARVLMAQHRILPNELYPPEGPARDSLQAALAVARHYRQWEQEVAAQAAPATLDVRC